MLLAAPITVPPRDCDVTCWRDYIETGNDCQLKTGKPLPSKNGEGKNPANANLQKLKISQCPPVARVDIPSTLTYTRATFPLVAGHTAAVYRWCESRSSSMSDAPPTMPASSAHTLCLSCLRGSSQSSRLARLSPCPTGLALPPVQLRRYPACPGRAAHDHSPWWRLLARPARADNPDRRLCNAKARAVQRHQHRPLVDTLRCFIERGI